ncbi:MAG: LytTR family DNA-binding domain-containing protein [Acidobacteriia bacterium]|nr:LytTR family DNA-binding domain-containing protein [Terriglobia bacterium]
MNDITTLIVDDEPLAREKLRMLLGHDPMFRVVQECSTGREAIQAIYAHRPQVMFLDVQMPDVDGFGALNSIDLVTRPLVVLTTAYSNYAVQAFEAEVLDYLLKPFDEERLGRCIRRIKARLLQSTPAGNAADTFHKTSDAIDRFLVKSEGRILFFDAKEIDWIEAASNYAEIHTGSQSFLIRHTMNELERKLNPMQFLRIHRSFIVNLAKIRGVQPCSSGEYMIRLQSGKELPSSRGYRDNLASILKNAI